MRITYANEKLKFCIGDVRNQSSINDSMHGVDYVFHAAALKQVPSCEFYPMEAVQTNIIGTQNVLTTASACGVKKVVVLSTDKAVYPINAMGISKAMAEKVMIAKSRNQTKSETIFCGTRYGNVMASRGSVIPLFISQLLEGKPITITDPNMTRFLMSLEDSVDLVLHAYSEGRQGDILVQKSPASTVADLAQALQEIFLKKNKIKVIGTRHGEKLYESLISREEMARSEDMGKYFRIPSDNRDLNYAKYFSQGEEKISYLEDYTSHSTQRLNIEQLKELLLKLDYVKEALNV
jgi:UDP-glucose 4-epimerase